MKKLYLLFVALLLSTSAFSQSLEPEVLSSSGDYFTSTNIKLNWTLGEMVTETFIAGSNILTQGFQQPNYLYTAVDETAENKEISIYPNPFSDVVTINTGNYTGVNVNVYDLQGKNLIENNINKSNLQLDFSAFAPGIYFIKIYNSEKILKTFKVQKINN